MPEEWDGELLARAYEPLTMPDEAAVVLADAGSLRRAYRYCARLTQLHSRTFSLACALLPRPKRQAAQALYAFCRVSDDLVDRPGCYRGLSFSEWRTMALSTRPPADDPVALAWADARSRFGIPLGYAEQLLEGIAMDLQVRRYRTFRELARYCYAVACTVGLMFMHIVDFTSRAAIPYALRLGVALQLTNILRDVGDDWQRGRLYLPLEELSEFGLSEEDIAVGRADSRWREFLAFQIGRARCLYDLAMPGVALLGRDGRLAVAAAAELYRAILHEIEKQGGDVFSKRAYVSLWGKVRRLPRAWWRSQRALAPVARPA